MSPEEEIIRAGEARQIIESKMFLGAKAHVLDQLAQARRAVPMTSTDMHSRLILAEQIAGYFFDYFEQIAQTGKLAEMQLEERRRQQSLMEQGVAMFRRFGRNAP
jgi:hypothetical protein